MFVDSLYIMDSNILSNRCHQYVELKLNDC